MFTHSLTIPPVRSPGHSRRLSPTFLIGDLIGNPGSFSTFSEQLLVRRSD